MSEIAVNYILDKLVPFFEREAKLLSGVRREIEDVKYELESMRAFLRDADARTDSDEGVKAWVKQVKDVAYDTEDVLDEFMLRFAPQPRTPHGSICKLLRKAVCLIRRLKARHQIGTQIQDIKVRVHDIQARSQRYGFNSSDQGSSHSRTRSDIWHDPRASSLFIDDSEIVGIDEPKKDIIAWLLKGESRRTAVSVIGMGGSGKTTLVKKIYDDERVRFYFECHIWITVSESYKIEELLQSMIRQSCEEEKSEPLLEGANTMLEIQLMEKLRERLHRKRYVIVFDDVWSIQLWECVGSALPDSYCGSRIMVTTRNKYVASSFVGSSGHIYTLRTLPSNEAWKLFCKKAFSSNNGEGSCPPELEELSREILRRCEGLPLAIVAIGGLLSTKDKTLVEWKKLYDSLGSELGSNPKLTSLSRILSLSYNDLPYYLKSCFLYFGIFPGDQFINVMKLRLLWIAEGFVKEQSGKTFEDVAEDYMNELIDRCLIQVGFLDFKGRPVDCRVHDIFREIILSKCKEDNFTTVITEQNAICSGKIRRLSIHNQDGTILQQTNSSHLRSFFVFGANKPNSSLSGFFSGPRLLRILDLEGVPLESFLEELASLFHLRFLSLMKTKIRTLPPCLGKLQNLETLDLRHTFVSELPIEVLNLLRLRHLLVSRFHRHDVYAPYDIVFGMKVHRGIGNLKELQTLQIIDAAEATNFIRELGNLTQLRAFGVTNLRREDGMNLCFAMEKMCSLRTLNVLNSTNMEDEVLDLESLLSPPPLLQRLYIKGRLERVPHWIARLQSLMFLSLRWSRLRDDPIKIIHTLPNLVQFELSNAYDGEKLCFEAGGFQRLKMLTIDQLEGLKSIRVEEGALPNLQKLYIWRCQALESVPVGIEEYLVNLKELHLYDMPQEFVKKLRKDNGGINHHRIKHIPLVRHVVTKNWEVEKLNFVI